MIYVALSMVAGKVFWDINCGKFWDYFVWNPFLFQYIFELQLYSLISVGVCWTEVSNV
jgi:hypothetical protein